MFEILFYILIFSLLVIIAILFVFLFLWILFNIINKVPFVPVPNYVLPEIEKVIKAKDGGVVYDLGCGDGKVLFYLSQKNPKAEYIGIENNIFLVLLSRLKARFNKIKTGNKVEILNSSFFSENLSKATHIFVYLFPEVMDELLPKLEKELLPGTILVSATFQFSKKKETNCVTVVGGKNRLVRNLYIYKF